MNTAVVIGVGPLQGLGAYLCPGATAVGEDVYPVSAEGCLQTAEEFGDIIVRANPDGSMVRLRDVARVEQGMSFKEAALQSTKLRFRPIMMTAVSFIFGVMPLVLSSGPGAVARQFGGTNSALHYTRCLNTHKGQAHVRYIPPQSRLGIHHGRRPVCLPGR